MTWGGQARENPIALTTSTIRKRAITRNLDNPRILAARLFATGLLLASTGSALAEVHYVDLNSANAPPPYTNWVTAATNIQDAVDVAAAGDEVVVTNAGLDGKPCVRQGRWLRRDVSFAYSEH